MENLIRMTGMSNGELAEALNVSPVTISNWRRGRTHPPKRKLLKLMELSRTILKLNEHILTSYETCFKLERNPE